MRTIDGKDISRAVCTMCIGANYALEPDVLSSLKKAARSEKSPVAKTVITKLIENARIAREGVYPLCQDTGLAWFYVEQGNNIRIKGMTIREAITKGVAAGYKDGYLRKSIVGDPLRRKNTGTNLPAIIYEETVAGDVLRIHFAAKGGGSENMSRAAVLTPAEGEAGIVRFITETVRAAGGNPCPPLVIGVGLGGTIDAAAVASKRALFRKLGSRNSDAFYRKLEQKALTAVNSLGIGPMGFGGKTTALALHIHALPCHIASLPIAVTINCHSHRHGTVTL